MYVTVKADLKPFSCGSPAVKFAFMICCGTKLWSLSDRGCLMERQIDYKRSGEMCAKGIKHSFVLQFANVSKRHTNFNGYLIKIYCDSLCMTIPKMTFDVAVKVQFGIWTISVSNWTSM